MLRQFVKVGKKNLQPKSVPTVVFNQWLSKSSFGGLYQANSSGLGSSSYASHSYMPSYPPQKPSEDDIDKYLAIDEDSSSSDS